MIALFKIIWALVVALLLVALFYAHSMFPDTVGTHFTADRIADWYLTRDAYFYSFVGILVLQNMLLLGMAALTGRLPVHSLPIPSRSFWAADLDHRTKARQILSRGCWMLATCLNAILLLVHLMVFDLNSSFFDSPQPYLVYIAVAMFFFTLAVASIPLRLSYRKLDILELSTYSGSRG
jgi:hypothetical protein